MTDRVEFAVSRTVGAIAYLAALVVLWYLVVKVFGVSPLVIPPPDAVWKEASGKLWILISNTALTLAEALIGFAAALIVGTLCAVGIVSSRLASQLLLPSLVAVNSAPKVVVAPILVLWLGLGLWSKVGMAFLLCFFPIVINVVQGLREVDPELIDLYRLMKAKTWTIMRRVRMPSAVGYLLSGCKIALPLAIIGAVIGEFVASRAGLGYQVLLAYSSSNLELVFAAVITITIASVLLFQLLLAVEKLILYLYPVSVEGRR